MENEKKLHAVLIVGMVSDDGRRIDNPVSVGALARSLVKRDNEAAVSARKWKLDPDRVVLLFKDSEGRVVDRVRLGVER